MSGKRGKTRLDRHDVEPALGDPEDAGTIARFAQCAASLSRW
jgi:hypothetical protein